MNDMNYARLNAKFALSFLLRNKKKSTGKLASFDNLRKYEDAILWSASMCKERLSYDFYSEMDKFLSLHKREITEGT